MLDPEAQHFHVNPGGRLHGVIRVPGDKSISHRALMLAAIAEGTTEIDGLLQGHDVLATQAALCAMGVQIQTTATQHTLVHGVGLHGLQAPSHVIDCGNSGTTLRLLTGLLAGQSFATELTGDDSLIKRPMRRVIDPLKMMGAAVEARDGYPPIKIHPVSALHGISYEMPVASAQVKSALLLAGLYARDETAVVEVSTTRDHTERMLQAFHYPIVKQENQIRICGGGTLQAAVIQVPADISSAAFFMVGASIAPGSDVLLSDVGVNPTRSGIITLLKQMGADITLQNTRYFGNEPVADIRVRYAPLRGITIPAALVPLAIDEFPVLFIAAANASGETVLTGAQELRVKESDRIQVMAEGLQQLGVTVQTTVDGIRIQGGRVYGGGEIQSHGDHRVAMAFAIAALTATAPINILRWENVATSFPGFVALARQAGLEG